MASKGQPVTLTYQAWNTNTLSYQTGDASNHTLRLVKDGTEAAPTNSPVELDSTNAPGRYTLLLTTAEATFNLVTLTGKSSTLNVVLIDISMSFDNLPTIAPGSAGGIPITDSTTNTLFSNVVRQGTAQGGAAGSITLDAGASATNNLYQGEVLWIYAGTGVGQSAIIASYVGSTKVAGITGLFATVPDNTSKFAIFPFGTIAASISGAVTVQTILSSAAQFKKGVQSPAFVFALTDNTGHQPTTGKFPIVQISKDTVPLVNASQAPVEIGGGLYYIPFFTAAEMNCNALGITITALGADGYGTVIYTQP